MKKLNEENMDLDSSTEATKSLCIDLRSWLHKCAYLACSFIRDDNLSRTLDRIELFIKLCEKEDQRFLKLITKRLTDLQIQKEDSGKAVSTNWLVKDVAALRNVQQYSTLRKACQNHLETKLSPLLGYLLSYIDSYYNLDVFYDSYNCPWKYNLWLNIFNNDDIIKCNYKNMLSKGEHEEELKLFTCKSQWTLSTINNSASSMVLAPVPAAGLKSSSVQMKPKLPFFWLLTNTLKELYDNFMQTNMMTLAEGGVSTTSTSTGRASGLQFEQYKLSIPQLFERTEILKIIDEETSKETTTTTSGGHKSIRKQFIDEYINDFILFNCKLSSDKDLSIISRALHQLFDNYKIEPTDLKLSLPMVHYEYEQIRERIELYLKFVQLQPSITDKLEKAKDSNRYIDIEACIYCMSEFKAELLSHNLSNIREDTRKLCIILQLVSGLLLTTKSDDSVTHAKMNEINEGFQSLKAINLLIEDIILNIDSTSQMKFIHRQLLCNRFTNIYMKTSVNFREFKTLEQLSSFLLYCVEHAKGTLLECW